MQGDDWVSGREWVSEKWKAWCKLVESLEGSSEGEMRHEEYVQRDLFQVIHVAHVMVGICEGSYQIGKLVPQSSSCRFMAKSSHHVEALLVQAYSHRLW